MRIEVCDAPFNPWQILQDYQAAKPGRFGATTSFVGSLRDFNQGDDDVQGMFLEHYPGMTEKYLHRIAATACERWSLLDALIIHRVGAIDIGEPIVLVAAWAAHRDAAFLACRYLIDELKSQAPFWKRERLSGGERWVELEQKD